MKHEYPRFYVKQVGRGFSITHRLTHCFIETLDSEEELVERMKYWTGLTLKELWEFLLNVRYVTPPKKNPVTSNRVEKDSEEDWFRQAWSVYTDTFYNRYPKLLQVDAEFPHELIMQVRRERYDEERKRYLIQEEERKGKDGRFVEETPIIIEEEEQVEEKKSAGKLKIKRKKVEVVEEVFPKKKKLKIKKKVSLTDLFD